MITDQSLSTIYDERFNSIYHYGDILPENGVINYIEHEYTAYITKKSKHEIKPVVDNYAVQGFLDALHQIKMEYVYSRSSHWGIE